MDQEVVQLLAARFLMGRLAKGYIAMAAFHDRDRGIEGALHPRESEEARKEGNSAFAGSWLARHILRVEETTPLSCCGMLANGVA